MVTHSTGKETEALSWLHQLPTTTQSGFMETEHDPGSLSSSPGLQLMLSCLTQQETCQ